MVGKEVACASPMSFIAARGLSAPHALTRTYSTMRSSSGKRTDGWTVSPVCLPTAALHRHPSTSDKSRNRGRHSLDPFRPGSNHGPEPSRNPKVNKQGGPLESEVGRREMNRELIRVLARPLLIPSDHSRIRHAWRAQPTRERPIGHGKS